MILEKMLVLFLIMAVGFIAAKKDMITPEASKKFSGIIVNIANPAIILSSVLESDLDSLDSSALVNTAIVAVIMYAALILLAEIIVRVMRVPAEQRGIYRLMTVFSNIGYMGYPVIQSIYGSTALIYASVFLIPFNILIYTYGIFVMRKKGSGGGFKLRTLFNNGVIACLIMLVIIIFKLRIPTILSDTIIRIGDMVVPISMMIIGASLADFKPKELFSDVRLLIYSAIRLIVLPLAGALILKPLVADEMLMGVTMVMLATPVGSLTAMMASEYGGDTKLTSKGIALTTIASVITLPLVFKIAGI